ncbi:MAG: hypothetical protein ACOCRO_07525 [Halanaerobiales bacterium]
MIGLLILFICGLFGSLLGYTYYSHFKDQYYCNYEGIFTGLGSGFLIGLLIILILISGIAFPTKYVVTNKQPIYALDGTNSIEGSFFLGTGSVNSSMKYYYLVKEDGGYSVESVPSNRVVIYYSNTPRIKTLKLQYKNDFLKKHFPLGLNRKYKIYIPEGTIKHDFEVPPFEKG